MEPALDDLAKLRRHLNTPLAPLAEGHLGTVLREQERRFLVRLEAGERWAFRAVSCLVRPAPGDEVLLTELADGRAFVLAVLARDRAQPTTLVAEGDLRIAPTGTCALEPGQGVDVRTAGEVNVQAGSFTARAPEGRLMFDTLTALATRVVARMEDAHLSGGTFHTVAEQVSQTVRRCLRKVSELDQLRAEHADWRTEKELTLRAENLLSGVRKLIKLDGGQIHLG
jgi:hypothetical protein